MVVLYTATVVLTAIIMNNNKIIKPNEFKKATILQEDNITVRFEKTTVVLNGKNYYRIYMEFIAGYEREENSNS